MERFMTHHRLDQPSTTLLVFPTTQATPHFFYAAQLFGTHFKYPAAGQQSCDPTITFCGGYGGEWCSVYRDGNVFDVNGTQVEGFDLNPSSTTFGTVKPFVETITEIPVCL
jgi:hypothetical protein